MGSSSSPPCTPVDVAVSPVEKESLAAVSVSNEGCIETTEAEDSEGITFEQLSHIWSCKNPVNASSFDKQLLPSDGSLKNTKWESILSVDPSRFLEMYLSQYPGDTRAVQPVVIFSHKALNSLEEAPDVCKVLDIAVVPDTPGVCVAVTETFHDVASYHMLHADRKEDGTFSLTSNYLEGRNLPTEEQYSLARGMLSEFFQYGDQLVSQTAHVPNLIKSIVGIPLSCLVESDDELELFSNSVEHLKRSRMSIKSIFAFSSSKAILKKLTRLNVQIVDVTCLAGVGSKLTPLMRRYFLQAWLAFVLSDAKVRVVWQGPATVWLNNVNSVIAKEPNVEVLWAFKGRKDNRAAPFFVSFDLLVTSGSERAAHLMHELMLHFDLILAWDSLDAVAAYRLSENNARYGTTTRVFAAPSVLHIDVMGRDPVKLLDAVSGKTKPDVIVFPQEGMTAAETKALLIKTDMWVVQSRLKI